MSIMVGVGRGALEGVLIKDAAALERLEKVTTLVVDKTGTLTEGRPSLQRVVAAKGFDEADVLRLAAAAEDASEHPLARAIVAGSRLRAAPAAPLVGALAAAARERARVVDFVSDAGRGVVARVGGRRRRGRQRAADERGARRRRGARAGRRGRAREEARPRYSSA